jgi:hypothetical protein
MGDGVPQRTRQPASRRTRIIGDVYAAWVAEHVSNRTLHATLVGEVNGEENAELAFLSADADAELLRRTTAALRAAGL